MGQDLVERAAQARGVHHARRAAEVRDELRLRYKLATAVERVEGELLELGTTLRGISAVPRRVRRDVAISLLARLKAEVAARATGVPESWVACLGFESLGAVVIIQGHWCSTCHRWTRLPP